jgi:transcriptional regulator with XRE-family HTH domain
MNTTEKSHETAGMETIRALRCNLGWSLGDLAERLDGVVTRQALHKYETGEARPSPTVLSRLAEVFGVKPLELVAGPDFTVLVSAFRKRQGLSAKEEKRIREQFVNETRKRVAVLIRCGGRLPAGDRLDDCAGKMPELAAESLRKNWGLGETPISDLTTCLEDHGIHAVLLDTKEGFDGVCAEVTNGNGCLCGYAVGVRDTKAGGRTRFTLAHELGHLVLHTPDEASSNAFAGAFLAPRAVMVRRLGAKRNRIKRAELDELVKELRISPDAVVRRAYDLNIIDKESYTFWNQALRRYGIKKTDDIPAERSAWLQRRVLHGLAEKIITEKEARGWLGDEQFEKLLENDTPATTWELRKMTKAQRLELLEQSAEAAEAYYNGEEADIVEETGEVYEDGGLS